MIRRNLSSLVFLVPLSLALLSCSLERSDKHSQMSTYASDTFEDFYEQVAAGAETCADLQLLSDNCGDAPGGIWGDGGPGKLGNAVASCRLAVDSRNLTLQCW